MNAQINRCLSDVRRKLAEDWDGPAYGPGSMGTGTDKGDKAEPGEGGAENSASYVDNSWDMYIQGICDELQAIYDVEEGQAMGFIQSVADEMASEGMIPEYPKGGHAEDEEALAIWIGKAKSSGLHGAVFQKARDLEAK